MRSQTTKERSASIAKRDLARGGYPPDDTERLRLGQGASSRELRSLAPDPLPAVYRRDPSPTPHSLLQLHHLPNAPSPPSLPPNFTIVDSPPMERQGRMADDGNRRRHLVRIHGDASSDVRLVWDGNRAGRKAGKCRVLDWREFRGCDGGGFVRGGWGGETFVSRASRERG